MVEGGIEMIKSARLLTAGSCGQNEKITNTKKPFRHIQFPAHFILIQHRTKGNILVDTGYSDHFFKGTMFFPYNIYAKLTPVKFKREDSAIEQLKKIGIEKEDISYIFITHFHADHIAGLKDFPNATFICSREAYAFIKDKKGISALKQAFVPSLLPNDFKKRILFIEDQKFPKTEYQSEHVQQLTSDGHLYDLFGDGSLISMDLTGHAKGQFGLYFETGEAKVWLVADATWDSDAFKHLQLPSILARFIMYDSQMFQKNVLHLHSYHQKHPEVLIVPSHCRTIKEEWEKKI